MPLFATPRARRRHHRHRSAERHTRRRQFFRPRLEALEDRRLLAVDVFGVPEWTEIGPRGILPNGEAPHGVLSGAVQAIAASPVNPGVVFVGTVNGGIWRTNDSNANVAPTGGPAWTPLTDQFPAISISSLEFSPLDDKTLFAGTGKASSYDGIGNSLGILRGQPMGGADPGYAWSSHFQGLPRDAWIADVLPTSIGTDLNTQIVIAGTRGKWNEGGLHISRDGGATWTTETSILLQTTTATPGHVTDLMADPDQQQKGRFYFGMLPNQTNSAAAAAAGVWRGTWNDNGTPATTSDDVFRYDRVLTSEILAGLGVNINFADLTNVKLASQRIGGTSYLYAGLVTGDWEQSGVPASGRLQAILLSTDGGAHWQTIGAQTGLGSDVHDNKTLQGHKHFSLAADPTLPRVIYVGGDVPPNIYRFMGGQWQSLSKDVIATGLHPHADSRVLLFDDQGRLLEGDDGGIYRLADPHAAAPVWSSLNGNLGSVEEVTIVYDRFRNTFVTGTQDNAVAQSPTEGTHWQTVVGRRPTNGALDVRSGDGRSQEVAYPASGGSVLYSMRNRFQWLSRHEFAKEGSQIVQKDVISVPLKRAGNTEPWSGLSQRDRNNEKPTLRPLAVNSVASAAERLLLGGHDLYESDNRGNTIRKLATGAAATDDGMYVSLVYGGRQPGTENVIYAGRRDKLYVREAHARPFDPVQERTPVDAQDGSFAEFLTDIAVHRDDWRIAYVSDRNRIWRTTDAGLTWRVIFSTDPLVGTVWSLAVATEAGRDVLIMGTDNGVYRAIAPDDPNGRWTVTRFGRNLPNVPVLDVRYYPEDRDYPEDRGGMLVAGTLGRGTWIIENLTDRLSRPSTLRIVGEDPGPTGDDRFRLQRSATNPLMLEVYVNGERQQFRSQDPHPAPAWETTGYQIPVASIESIEVLGGAGDDWLRIDSTHGPLDVVVTFNGQAGSDNQLRLFQARANPTQTYAASGSGLHRVSDNLFGTPVQQDAYTVNVAGVSLEGIPQGGENPVASLGQGLNRTGDALRADAITATRLPVVGRSVNNVLDGRTAASPSPLGGAGPDLARVEGPLGGGASTLLRRMIETGPNAFALADIGTDRIPTLEDLRQRLDDLDDVPGNVTLNPRGTVAGTTLLDVKIVDKTLTGVADLLLDTELLGGTVNMAGLMGLQADVTMHLRVGVDDRGFFIDPGNNPDPEFVVRNLRFSGNASAQGQFGIVEASLSGVQLQFDEAIRISIDLHDPGAGAVDDGYIRLDGPGLFELSAGELTDLTNNLMSVSVDGGGSGHDVTLTGTFSVAPLVPDSDTDPFSALANAEITLVWPDLAEPTTVQVDLAATSSLGQQFVQLLHVSVDQVATGLRSLGPVLEQIAATPVMSSRLPLLGRSLSQVLQSAPSELLLNATAGRAPSVSEVVERDGYRTFEVIVEDLAFSAEGVAAGDRVYVRPAAGGDPIEATIASVELGHLTVQYAATNPQLPDRVAPELRIVRQGSLSRRLEAMLSSLTGATAESFALPTFQDLAHQLADLVGIDVAELPITLRTDPLALEWTLPLELAPLEYQQPLNFDAGVPGLSLRSDGAFVFAVAPNMQLTVGLLLEPSEDIPLSERFYVAEGSQVTLQVDAQVTGSGLTGSLGFVDLLVGTQQLQLTGTVGARLSGPIGNPTTPISIDPLLDARLDAVLPVSIDVGGDEPIEILTVQLHHMLSTADDFAAVASNAAEQLASLADYSNITPQMVAQALSTLVGQLRRLGLGPVLDAEIPLINQSLADLAILGDTLADLDGLSAESVGTVKRLAHVLGAERVEIAPQEVRFHFGRDSRFVRERPLAFGVGEDFDLLSLSGEGTLQVEARADGQLALGISTAPGIALADRFFLVPQETQFVMGATANVGYDVDSDGIVDAAPLTVRAHVLGVPVEVSEARALLRLAGQASLADQNDGAGDDTGKLTLRELAAGGFAAQFVPTEDLIQAILPIDAGPAGIAAIDNNQFDPADLVGTGDAVVEILGRLSDLPGGLNLNDSPVSAFHTNVTQLVTPGAGDAIAVQAWNLDAFVSQGVLSFESLLGGLTQLVDWADALLGTDVLDYKLPFINRSLRDGLNFIGTVGATCDGDPETLGQLVTCVLAKGLGGTMSEAAEALARFLADEGAIEPRGDLNGDGRDDWRDILQIEGDPADPTSVTFQFRFTPAFDPFGTTWHGFDLGTDLLKLTSDGGLSVSFQPNLTMLVGFGVDQNGFFIKTDFDEPEIQMDATLQLHGDATLQLGFVNLAATFDDNDRLTVQLSADLADGTTGKVRLSDLLNVHRIERIVDASALGFHVEAGLNVPLELEVDLAGFEFTALAADLVVHWVPVSTSESTDGDPTIELKNVRVPVGELFNRLGGTVLEEIRRQNPLAPLLDVLNEELPVLGKSLLDLFQDENEGLTQNAVWQLLATSNSIAEIANYELFFGDVLFERGPDGTLQKLPGTGSAEDGFDEGTPLAEASVPGGNLPGVIGEAITSAATNLGITFPILKLSNILNFLVFEKDADLVRFEFPIPLRIPILAAYDATIGSFGIPKLLSVSAGVEYNVGLSFVVDLALGLDTRGLRSDREKLATSFGILDGLWIGDFDPNLDGDIVPGGIDRPEVRLEGAIEGAVFGSAEVAGFDLGRVRGSASIAAGVGIDLNDDNAQHGDIDHRSDEDRYDGKFHLDEMALVLADHSHAGHDAPFLCLFDLTGSITAALGIDVKIDLWIKTLKKRFEKNWTLLRFEVGCDATPPAIAVLNGRVLELRGTPEPDHFEIELTQGNMLRVTQDGQSLEFAPADVDYIVGDLGDGSDIVFVDSAVTAPVILSGGLGDDELTAGAGGGRLLGGPGHDTLTTAEISAPVVIVGGGDDDYIRGGSSADELVGDYNPTFDPRPEENAAEGSDTILGGPDSTWSGTVYPADGTDLIWGDNAAVYADGTDPDVGNFTDDFITIEGGAARVWAGSGDDFVSVGTGRVTAYGGAGDDTMRGGDEADVLVGEAGNDFVIGGRGHDQLFGGSYFDPAQPHPPVAFLSLGQDQLDGGDGDDLLDGFDSTYVRARGGEGSDLIIGSQGSDELRGGSGDDVIFAGPGSDLVRGGSGNDVILGGSGTIDGQTLWPNFQSASSPRDRTDRLFGDDGDDILVGDNGRVTRWTLTRTVLFPQDPTGGGGTTTYVPYTLTDYHTEVIAQTAFLFGQSDLIVGGTGDDVVLGGDESDLIYGDSDFVHFQGALPLFPPVSAPGHDVHVGDNGEFVRRITYRGSDLLETTRRVTSTTGMGGADTILGDERALAASGGNDMIFGGEGGDFLWGSGGGDTIFGDLAHFQESWTAAAGFVDRQVFSIVPTLGGDDTIDGGAGIDGVAGGFGNDQLWGGDDADVVLGDHGRVAFTSTGAPGRAHSVFPETGGDDQLVGGSGTDFVIGGFGRDTLWGGDGNDPNYLFGDNATVVFADGSAQANTLSTGFDEYGERDTIYGADGPDYILAGLGNDVVYGQGGNDQVLGEFGTIVRDELGAVTAMYPLAVLLPVGAQTNDILWGGPGNDILHGDYGDDVVRGEDGDDIMSGGVGNDWVAEVTSTFLILSDTQLLGRGVDQLDSFERGNLIGDGHDNLLDAQLFSGRVISAGFGGNDTLIGGRSDDTLDGGDEDDILIGGAGDDYLLGRDGNDQLDGGTGHDLIDGGAGDDTHYSLFGTGVRPTGLYHTWTVSTTADAGGGSLRWALENSATLPADVLVVIPFQIPTTDPNFVDIDAASGGDAVGDVHVIANAAPLPALSRGNVIVNGLSRAFSDVEDTNPAGPNIVLDGRYALPTGLALASDRNHVYGLNLQRFMFAGLNVVGHDNVIAANYIGTDPSASDLRWNAAHGIQVNNASGNRIGLPGLGNVIGGNAAVGVLLTGDASSNNVLHDNSIGTDPTGTRALGNGGPGIVIMGAAPSGNVIGGLLTGEGNRIAFNHGEGIFVSSSGERGTLMRGNAIYSNDELGSDLSPAGVTENDPLDADAGANRLQNYPVVTFATMGEQLRVAGSLHSTPLRQYSLDFYASDDVDPSGYGEGQRYVGSVVVVTDAAGDAQFDEYLPAAVGADEWITATATEVLMGDTSEFSLAHSVRDVSGLYIVTNTRDSGPGSLRAAIEWANGVTTDGPATIEFAIPATDAGFVDVDALLAGGDPARDVFVVTALTPLPALTRGRIVLDGQSQHNLTGDTNPFGPEIVLAGHLAGPAANGLELRSAENRIHGLNIQGFGGNGILSSGNGNTVTGNYIGTDPTGNFASQAPSGLVSSWYAEGSADDSTGNNHGTLVNGTSFAPGRSGQAFQFDGVDDYVATPLVVDYTAGATFELWVSTLGDGGNTLMAGGGGATRDRGMGLFLEGGRPLFMGTKGTAGIPNFVLYPNLSIADGQFHHLVGTWTGDTTPDGVKLYLDGQLVGSTTAQVSVPADGTPLYLGDHPAYYLPFRGLIDEPAVYGRVLSEGEVAARFRTGGPATANGGGVRIDHGDGNRIGGTRAADRNVISANGRFGVRIEGNSVAWPGPGDPPIYTDNPDQFRFVGNSVVGNILGLAADGSTALGNGASVVSAGIFVINSANNAISDNTVSGNRGDGVAIQGGHTNRIENNLIGTTADGTASVGNTGHGILVSQGSQRNEVLGNVVSGNLRHGIAVNGSSNRVQTEEFGSLLNTFFNSWTGYGNEQNRDNFGYVHSNFTQGTPGSEAGGTFARASSALGETVEYDSYYADTDVGRFTLNDQLQASGELIFTALNNFNGSVEIGYLNTVSAQANQYRNALSLRVLEPSPHQGTTGIRVLAEITLANGTRVYGTAVNAGPGLALNVPYTWELNYNPGAGANNQGELEVRISAAGALVGTSIVSLTAAHRSIGASFDAFGLLNSAQSVLTNNPNTITMFVDNLRYTHQAAGHTIQGNFIGTDKLGASALPNAAAGLVLTDAAPTQIGGTEPGQGNVLSGNNSSGIEITGGANHRIQGNFIGTDATGTVAISNTHGISLINSANNLIGGGQAEARNVISSSGTNIRVLYDQSTGNRIQGNYIGVNESGTAKLGNNAFGVNIAYGANGNIVGTDSDGIDDAFEGNLISGITGVHYAIAVAISTDHNVVAGNLIGTNPDGTESIPNTVGVWIAGSHNRIGTNGDGISDAFERNVINQLEIQGAGNPVGAEFNTVAGNYIGTDITGNARLGVGGFVFVRNNADFNVIGTNGDGQADDREGNVIAGINGAHAIQIETAKGNQVAGNHLGVGADGTTALDNPFSGVFLRFGAQQNTIGGPLPAQRNLIAGNGRVGVHIAGEGTDGNIIVGNWIGLDAQGHPLGNAQQGILLDGVRNTRIGDSTPGAGNVIAANALEGIRIVGGSGHTIQGNRIGTDPAGTTAIGNLGTGVAVTNATGVAIGGRETGAGNVISGNRRHAIHLLDGSGHTVQGNVIGTDLSGEVALPNSQSLPNAAPAVFLERSRGNQIGGGAPGAGNLISGNAGYGVAIFGDGADDNKVQGNRIGTDASGAVALPNFSGVVIGNGVASGNIIGVDGDGLNDAEEGNLISGHVNAVTGSSFGVVLSGTSGSRGNVLAGNKIGTDLTGAFAIPNSIGIWMPGAVENRVDTNVIAGNLNNGVQLDASAHSNVVSDNWIGLNAEGAALGNQIGIRMAGGAGSNELVGNVVAGNRQHGIDIVGGSGNVIQGNRIGANPTGQEASGNGGHGIYLSGAAADHHILDNTIARNQGAGIAVTGSAADNTIRQNRIFDNGGLGIDLGDDGVTPNDNGNLDAGVVPDLDVGPNALQNFPELQSVQPGLETRVTGQLRSAPGQSFVVDFYASPTADPTGFGEGQRWLGSSTVVANEEGVARFNVRLAATTYGGEFVTATATRLQVDGSESDTSEFSAALALKAGKGVRGANSFTLELVPAADGDPIPQQFATLDVELIGALDATDAFTPIDVAAFTTSISHDPSGPIGLPVSLATDSTSISPWLMEAVRRGTPFAQVILVGQSTIDGMPYEFARWTLDDVRLGSFATRNFARDEFTLVYDRLAYLYTPLTQFGAPGTPVEGVWDVTATGGFVPVALPEPLATPRVLTDVQYFAEIPGIPGNATLVGYAGWIESRSVDFALLGADAVHGERVRAGTVVVMADAGSASPRLLEAVASGQRFAAPIKIAAVRTVANEIVEFARWELDGASLVSYASASGRRDGFAITFDALHYSFADSGPDGRPLPPQSATLDRSDQGIGIFARQVELNSIAPASDARTLLARIPAAQGESQLTGYVGWTPINAFQFQLERPLTASGDTGAPYATSFSMLLPAGTSSPKLFELAALGTVLAEPVQVALVENANNSVFEFARWTLAGAEIGDYATAAATRDAVTVGYDQLTYQTQLPTKKGTPSAPIVGQWHPDATGTQPFNAPLDPSDELVLTNDVRLFVEVPGITGDAQAVGYVGWVPVDSYAFDLTNPLDFAGTPALASAFRFSARSGQASPELQSALVEGRTFATVNVVAVRQTMAGKLEEFARWKLSHAQVVSYATDSLLADTFEVSFGVLEYTFGVASTKKGAPPPVTGRWDLQATGSEVATRGPVVPDAVIPPDVRVLMQVPGVVGASQLVGYQGWIPLEAAGLTLARQSTPSQDVVLVSSFGVATSAGLHSPLVIDALARQHVYADDAPVRIVTLNTRDQDNIYETARWTLSDAQFTYYANHDLRQDGFAVAYDAWELEYKPTTSQGAAGAPIQLALDVDGTGTRLASAGAPLAAAASTEIKLFLKVPGIAGDSLRAGYVGWIQVSGAQFGIEQLWGAEASSWATPLFLELPTGLSAPRLMAAAANGMHVSYVELAAVHDSSSFEMARLRLDDIQWIHFVTRDARHDIVALTYDRLTLTWNNADPVTGIPSTTTEGQWPATIGDPLRSADPWAGQSEAESSTLTSTAGLSDATARDEARGWTAAGVQMVDGQYRHRFLRSGETITIINDAPWQNPINPLDANGDGVVSPRDALLIMNHLQADGPGPLAADGPAWDAPLRYLDVTGSRELESAYVSPLDALRILNALNSPQDAEGELAAAPIAQDTPFVPADVTGRSSRSFGLKRALVARPSDAIHDVAWPPAADAVPDWLVAPLVDAHAGTDERAQQARRTDAALLDLWDEAWSDEA